MENIYSRMEKFCGPIGSVAVSKPLPGYIRNEVKMARRAAGLEEVDKASRPGLSEVPDEQASAPRVCLPGL